MDNRNGEMTIESCEARDGNRYLTITRNGEVFRLNSNYRPANEAAKWAGNVQMADSGAVIFLFGLGNGCFARELLKRLSDDAVLILWEPSKRVAEFVRNTRECEDVIRHPQVHLFVKGENEREIFAFLDRTIHWSNAARQVFLVHPQYDKAFPEELAEFEGIVRSNNTRVFTNCNTEMHFGQAIAENTAFNMRYVPDGYLLQDLKGKIPEGVPAIVVSAGPSLDENIEDLKMAKGRAVIVATDTALRSLIRHQIIPDFTVTIDANKPPAYFADEESHRIPLFAKIQANKDVLRLHEAEKIWFDSQEYLTGFLHTIGRTPKDYHAGGSVATAAFSICSYLGFRTIILIGQDLAYRGEITHAGGEICAISAEEADICYVEGIAGGQVKTRHDWVQYLKWFERVIGEIQGEIRVIDATEGGAKIHGAEIMTLKEAIAGCCQSSFEIYPVMKSCCRPLSKEECAAFYHYLDKSLREAETMEQLLGELLPEFEQLLSKKEFTEAEIDSLKMKTSQAFAKMKDMDFFLLVDAYAKKDTIPAISEWLEAAGTKEEKAGVYLTSYHTVCSAFYRAADTLKAVLKEAEKERK